MPQNFSFPKAKKELIALGKKRGFLTQDVVLEKIPEPHKLIDELDKMYDYLFKKGIDVFEGIHAEIKEGQEEEKLPIMAILSSASAVDPVRIYLREIGKVPLLTADDEVRLAKDIEMGSSASRRVLIESNLRLVVSIDQKVYWPRLIILGSHPRR